MPLIKTTALGDIVVNDAVIAKAVIRSVRTAEGKIFLADENGRLAGSHSRVSAGDLAGKFVIEEEGERYLLTFFAVVSFGASIKNVTDAALGALQKEMEAIFPEYGGVLTMKIVGVKSKNIAPRDIEIRREYGPSR